MTEPTAFADWSGACQDPVFVLCAGRSGSTLLRFLLDAHPELACPPETELPALCTQLASVWSLFSAAAGPAPRGGATAMPEAVIDGMRHVMDLMIGPYLAQRGKKRYCDKSLGSARHAALLLRMYPRARFLCLYRHPMDVIASGLESCPWGLNSYGFEHYIAGSPTNAVAALGRYWADHTGAILAAETDFPARCHRVRYEDLVAAPEEVARRIFAFLGVAPAPGVTGRFLSHERERFGRSDFKIWNTSGVRTDSVGRGWTVPASMLPASLMTTINEFNAQLDYRRVDGAWGTAERPSDMLEHAGLDGAGLEGGAGTGVVPLGSVLLGERLMAGLGRLDAAFTDRWQPHAAERFLVSATTPRGGDVRWLVDLASRTIGPGDGPDAGVVRWRTAGTAEAWQHVIEGGANLGVVFRRGELRYSDQGDAGAGSTAADTRVAMLADLLGITTWPA
jgi:sulfotransferase family protein